MDTCFYNIKMYKNFVLNLILKMLIRNLTIMPSQIQYVIIFIVS
jgi:hypothetical protein